MGRWEVRLLPGGLDCEKTRGDPLGGEGTEIPQASLRDASERALHQGRPPAIDKKESPQEIRGFSYFTKLPQEIYKQLAFAYS